VGLDAKVSDICKACSFSAIICAVVPGIKVDTSAIAVLKSNAPFDAFVKKVAAAATPTSFANAPPALRALFLTLSNDPSALFAAKLN
jgi:hypothetical protein